jgi:hypothetical protein
MSVNNFIGDSGTESLGKIRWRFIPQDLAWDLGPNGTVRK